MNTATVQRDFESVVSSQVRMEPEGSDRFRIWNPFQFDDGDHLGIVLRRDGAGWVLSDEGTTYQHLMYADIDLDDLERGTRGVLLDKILSAFDVEDREGELIARPAGDDYASALFSLIQTMLKVSDLRFLTREIARATFIDDFRALVSSAVPASRLTFGWSDPEHDPEGHYIVDCCINGMQTPLFVFALPNDDRTRDATISLLQFERWGLHFQSLAVFQRQEEIGRKVLARYTDVGDKQFSSLETNRDRITGYLQAQIGR